MKNEIREILIKAFKDSTSTTNITFQPKFIDQALTQILAIIEEGVEKEKDIISVCGFYSQ